MRNDRLAVIIPTYLAHESLREAISSVRKAQALSKIEVKIIVVDNHPQSEDRVHSSDADLYMQLPSNPGFGAACNLGISKALTYMDTDWVMLLNPDAQVSSTFLMELESVFLQVTKNGTEDILTPIMPLICFNQKIQTVDFSKFFSVGVVGMNLHDPDENFSIYSKEGQIRDYGKPWKKLITSTDTVVINPEKAAPLEVVFHLIEENHGFTPNVVVRMDDLLGAIDYLVQNAGSEIYSPFSAGDLNWNYLASFVEKQGCGPRRAWCGAGVILPTGYIKMAGGFDESFFLYYEDTELSMRGLRNGIMPVFYPALRVYHQHSMITGRMPKVRAKAIWRSRQIFVTRSFGWHFSLFYSFGTMLKYVLMLVSGRTTFRHFIRNLLPEIYFSVLGSFESVIRSPTFRNLKLP